MKETRKHCTHGHLETNNNLEPVSPLFLVVEPSKTRSFPIIKTRVIWVPGTINGFGFDHIHLKKTPPQTTNEGHKMYTELLNARFSLTKL